jgi:hypothetical protein
VLRKRKCKLVEYEDSTGSVYARASVACGQCHLKLASEKIGEIPPSLGEVGKLAKLHNRARIHLTVHVNGGECEAVCKFVWISLLRGGN